MPIRSMNSLINELHKWQTEERTACAAFLIASDTGSVNIFVKGKIVDTSGLRLRIVGWGIGAFLLSGAIFTPKISAAVKEGIESLQEKGSPFNWEETITLEFPNGSLLALWSEK